VAHSGAKKGKDAMTQPAVSSAVSRRYQIDNFKIKEMFNKDKELKRKYLALIFNLT